MITKYIHITIIGTIISIAQLHALPIGDPRTPGISDLNYNIPVEQGVHEISLHTFIGASKIDYPDMTGTQFSPGFGAGFSYSYFFTPRWAITLGGGLQIFNNRGTDVNGYFSSYMEADDFEADGIDKVILYYDFRGYVETQWSMMVMIPLMLQYQTNESRNKAFYYAAGVKMGIPFAGDYKGSVDSAMVCGYYPNLWGELPAGYNFNECQKTGFGVGYEKIGFGDYGSISSYEKLKLNTAFFASIEAGVKWRLYNELAIYTGFWVDWAMNDVAIRSVNDMPFTWKPVTCNEEDPNTPCGKITFGSRTEGRAIPVSMGFTVRFAFGAGSHHKTADSVRWVSKLLQKDAILDESITRIDKLTADSIRKSDSLAMLMHRTAALVPATVDRETIQRRFDSLEVIRRADMERARLVAIERARIDSLERARILEQVNAMRLAEFNIRLGLLASGLDEYGVTQIIPNSRTQEKLDSVAALMTDYPDLRMRIIGHTCDMGTNEGSLRIGMQRAQSAKNYLVSAKSIDQSRIETATKADEQPLVPNTSEENRRKNRRIQVEIIKDIEEVEQEAK